MRNGDGFSAESETGSLAVPVPRRGLPLLLAPELLSRQLSERDPLGGGRPFPSRGVGQRDFCQARGGWGGGGGGVGQAAAGKHRLCAVAAAWSGLVGCLKLAKADQIKVLWIQGGASRKGGLET